MYIICVVLGIILYSTRGFRRIHLLPIFLFSGKPCVPLSSLLLQGLPLLPVHYKTRWMESVWWCSRSASFDVRSFSSCLYYTTNYTTLLLLLLLLLPSFTLRTQYGVLSNVSLPFWGSLVTASGLLRPMVDSCGAVHHFRASTHLLNVKQRLNGINGHMSCACCHLPAFTLWKLLFPS